MNDTKTKQQIIDKIKDVTNILVTVSNDPSVDELSAALGLTILLNKQDKHATAVFSGAIPPAITFLDPEKTFESTADSLRDFIIAIDKEKADHLRYKIDGDVVKIFITPYRTTITSDDLEFSQGDYNVELVIALGVENQEHLDRALEAHGKILHDATVITVSAGGQTSKLGSIDWRDENASSLSEMLVSLSESLHGDKKKLDSSVATAFLTGIVAATDRFSNNRTSSRVMTMAATLMAAGADQQLIAAKLGDAGSINQRVDDTQPIEAQHGESEYRNGGTQGAQANVPRSSNGQGELTVSHGYEGEIDQVAEAVQADQLDEAARRAQEALDQQASRAESSAPLSHQLRGAVDWKPGSGVQDEPLLGGTLNATTDQAEEDKRRELAKDKNHTILSHGYVGSHGDKPTYDASINSANAAQEEETVDIFSESPNIVHPEIGPARPGSGILDGLDDSAPALPPVGGQYASTSVPTSPRNEIVPDSVIDEQFGRNSQDPYMQYEPAPAPHLQPSPYPSAIPSPFQQDALQQPPQQEPSFNQPSGPTLAEIDAQVRNSTPHDEARQAVAAAYGLDPSESFGGQPAQPQQTSGIPLPPPPPLPDFSTLPPPPGMQPTPQQTEADRLGDIFGSEPASQIPPSPQPGPGDPGQFRIPN